MIKHLNLINLAFACEFLFLKIAISFYLTYSFTKKLQVKLNNLQLYQEFT